MIWFRVTEKIGKKKFRKLENLGMPSRVPVSISCHPATSCLIFAPVPYRWVFPPAGR
jgi:hypothetical protein